MCIWACEKVANHLNDNLRSGHKRVSPGIDLFTPKGSSRDITLRCTFVLARAARVASSVHAIRASNLVFFLPSSFFPTRSLLFVSFSTRRKNHDIGPCKLVYFKLMQHSRYSTMNFAVLKQELLHGLESRVAWCNIQCVPALGELRLRPPMSELSRHINIIYISIYSISKGKRRQ